MKERFGCESTFGSILDTASLSFATMRALLACFAVSCSGFVVNYEACFFYYRLDSSSCLLAFFDWAFSSRFVVHPEASTLATLVFNAAGS